MDDGVFCAPSSIVHKTMRIAYFDCFAGVSGDMILGALLDAGVSHDALREELARLPLDGYMLEARRIMRDDLVSTYVWLRTSADGITANGHAHGERQVSEHGYMHADAGVLGLIECITSSTLSSEVKRQALEAVRLLIEAESVVQGGARGQCRVHDGIPPTAPADRETLVEIVGVVAALALLGVDRV